MPDFDTYVTKTDYLPGARVLRRSKADANKIPPVPNPPVPDVDYGIIWVSAVEGFTRNHSGDPITGYDLTNTNPVFSNVIALLYPGGASDDNDVQFEVPVPQDMDLTDPQITVILHFLVPEPPFTPVPIPGGLPAGCEGAFLMNISSVWTAIGFTVDNLGFIVTDNAGYPVVSECP